MALFNTYSDANRTPYKGPDIRYAVKPRYYTSTSQYLGQHETPIYWEITRTSTRSYSYIGMYQSVARACADAMRVSHTMPYAEWSAQTSSNGEGVAPTVFVSQNYVYKCTASISMSNTAGNAYQVDVSENDTDTVISLTELKTDEELAAIFQIVDLRNPPAAGAIAITSAKWDSSTSTLVANFEQNVPDFRYQYCALQYKWGTDSWSNFNNQVKGQKSITANNVTENQTVRIIYGTQGPATVVSKAWTTCDIATPTFVVTSDSTASNSYALMTKVSGGYYFDWATSFTIIFTSDCTTPGRMTDKSKYTLYIDGYGHTSKYTASQTAVIKDVSYLGGNTYQMTATYSPDSNGTVTGPCSGVTGSRIQLYYDAFKILSNTLTVKPAHYIDIASVSASGVGTATTFTMTFKSSEDSAKVLANAKAYQISALATPTEITKSSLTYDSASSTYTFTGTSSDVSIVYGKGSAVVYLKLEATGEPVIQGNWQSVTWTPSAE